MDHRPVLWPVVCLVDVIAILSIVALGCVQYLASFAPVSLGSGTLIHHVSKISSSVQGVDVASPVEE